MKQTLNELDGREREARLRWQGLPIRIGPFLYSFRTALSELVDPLTFLYGDFPVELDADFVDFHIHAAMHRGLKGKLARQAYITCGGEVLFDRKARQTMLAIWEWGLNRCIYRYANQYLLLHSAVVERDGRALLIIGEPGSGKSTLCSALTYHGWRLLSDELAIVDPTDRRLRATARPIILKNDSIEIVQGLVPDAPIGPRCEQTQKGVVAHLRPPRDAVVRMDELATPRWIIFVKYEQGSATQVEPMSEAFAAMWTARNAFNYGLYGKTGFEIVADMVDACDCFRFTYSDTHEALHFFDRLSKSNVDAQSLAGEGVGA